jgi:hypothetical protein
MSSTPYCFQNRTLRLVVAADGTHVIADRVSKTKYDLYVQGKKIGTATKVGSKWSSTDVQHCGVIAASRRDLIEFFLTKAHFGANA